MDEPSVAYHRDEEEMFRTLVLWTVSWNSETFGDSTINATLLGAVSS